MTTTSTHPPLFSDFGLDERLTRALISQMGFTHPTPVQSSVIPLADRGLDVLVRARTGTGKTVAYAVPMLQKILAAKEASPHGISGVQAIVLVPSRELTTQASETLSQLCHYCTDVVSVLHLSASEPLAAQKSRLAELPDVVVSTPSGLAAHVKAGHLTLKDTLQTLVVDEADLMLSFGYLDELSELVPALPSAGCQTFLMSATLGDDIAKLEELLLHNPVVVRGPDKEKTAGNVEEHFFVCKPRDKFLVTLVLLKLRLLTGKVLVFVNDVSKCYKLKLFLDQFGVRGAVLNAELPQNSRYDVISQFGRGVFDLLIATDEAVGDSESDDDDDEAPSTESVSVTFPDEKKKKKKKRKEKKKTDEYSAARGVDFRDVQWVLNFDVPASTRAYTHRVGRTARGGARGSALLLVGEGGEDEGMLERIRVARVDKALPAPTAFSVDSGLVEGMRYRADDALGSITRNAVKKARIQEIKMQVVNSEALASHFAERPTELKLLHSHDTALGTQAARPALRHVPRYLVPAELRAPAQKRRRDDGDEAAAVAAPMGRKQHYQRGRRRGDPLKSFTYKGKRRKK